MFYNTDLNEATIKKLALALISLKLNNTIPMLEDALAT